MSEIWVYKWDGTVQCQPSEGHEISLDEMREQLAQIVGDKNILNQEKRDALGAVIAQCGTPTWKNNAYQITDEGFYLLMHGFVGPAGFQVYPDTKIPRPPVVVAGGDNVVPAVAADDRFVPWPFEALISAGGDDNKTAAAVTQIVASLTTVGAQPTMISELVGRACRIYKEGDMITMDWWPQRANIVLSQSGRSIVRIWFG